MGLGVEVKSREELFDLTYRPRKRKLWVKVL